MVVSLFTVPAKSIPTCTGAAFIWRYVASGRARAVIVVNSVRGWLGSLVDGVKFSYLRHLWFSWMMRVDPYTANPVNW